jgi:hypothetical protein
MHIDTIRVVEPEWLVEHVKGRIEKMRGMY